MSRATRHAPGKIQIGPKKKVAFVCSGGAAKAGAFHLGVALALQEQGFRFTGGLKTTEDSLNLPPDLLRISAYVGSSAGSIISSYLASGFTLEEIFDSFLGNSSRLPRLSYPKMFKFRLELAKEQFRQFMTIRKMFGNLVDGKWDTVLDMNWLKMTGLFSTSGIEQYLREEVLPSNRFEDLAADLFIVGTQLNHSRKVVFGKYHFKPPEEDKGCYYSNEAAISDACAASTALPFVYSPYKITGKDDVPIYYIDGEIRDTLSTHVAEDAGADLIIASHTHQPYHFTPAIGSLTEMGLPAILVQAIYLLVEQKINNHIRHRDNQRRAIDAVSRYCRQEGVDDSVRKRICGILEAELHHRMEVDTIYIHPRPNDSRMFIREHFSLAPKKMAEIVKSGFKAAIDVLRKYQFSGMATDVKSTPPSEATSV